MAAVREHSLDPVEQEILIDFFADANYQWHARLLLVRIDAQAARIVATPVHNVEALNHAIQRNVPMAGEAPEPARL
eukprot:1466942-Heterocapsa_arctica.AAC.1